MPVPTTLEFQNDSDLKLVVMHKRVNDVILQRIDDLLDQYHAYKSHQAKRHQILTLAFLYFSTEVWLKKSEQLRTDVNSRRKPAVERLYRDVVSELSQLLGIEINLLPMWFEDVFGTGMVSHGFEVDMTQGMFPQIRAEYFTREQLEKCRLYFLSGAAYVKRAGMLKRFNSSLYSHGFNQPISENFSGYVLGRNGQFYCHEHRVGSGSDGGFFHSGYFAGEPIICAGEIHVVNGEIREINNNSGHYRPSTTSLYTAVRLLEARGVNLNHVRVQSWEAGWHSGRTFLDAFGPKYNLAPGMPANHAFSSRLNQATPQFRQLASHWKTHSADVATITKHELGKDNVNSAFWHSSIPIQKLSVAYLRCPQCRHINVSYMDEFFQLALKSDQRSSTAPIRTVPSDSIPDTVRDLNEQRRFIHNDMLMDMFTNELDLNTFQGRIAGIEANLNSL